MRIHIDFEISPRAKRALKVTAAAVIVLGGSAALAGVPNTFKSGDSLSAQTMNDNFTSLDTRLAKLEAFETKLTSDGGYAAGATYCGASANQTMGDMSGLTVTGTSRTKARTQCQTTCGSPSAHMCTGLELDRGAELGLTSSVPSGWYASGAAGPATGGPDYECLGWSSALSTQSGPSWSGATGTYGAPSFNSCNVLYPVLCCD
jgi:hypothetical protein